MTASTPVPSGPVDGRAGLRGRLIEAAARAMVMQQTNGCCDEWPWPCADCDCFRDEAPELWAGYERAQALAALAAVLPLLVRAVEAGHLSPDWNGKSPDDTRLAYGMGHDHAILAAAALLRSLTEERG